MKTNKHKLLDALLRAVDLYRIVAKVSRDKAIDDAIALLVEAREGTKHELRTRSEFIDQLPRSILLVEPPKKRRSFRQWFCDFQEEGFLR